MNQLMDWFDYMYFHILGILKQDFLGEQYKIIKTEKVNVRINSLTIIDNGQKIHFLDLIAPTISLFTDKSAKM